MSSVQSTYNNIASHFDKTRVVIWSCVKDFIGSIPNINSKVILDAGCGNGKNTKFIIDSGCTNVYACDICESFIDICRSKYFNRMANANNAIVQCDLRSTPYENNTFDHVISIAVIHHLKTPTDRKDCIDELIRITKAGGSILITVCSIEEPFYSKKINNNGDLIDNPNKKLDINEQGDALVPWKNAEGELLDTRYYHFFSRDEFIDLCSSHERIANVEYKFEMSNHCIVLTLK
jgi:ubiquinone/menaquinone biosynthesis C-methylase UbiE